MRRLTAALILLASCGVDDEPLFETESSWRAEGLALSAPGAFVSVSPPPGIVFDQTALVPGDTVTFRVTGVAPGDTIFFGRSQTGVGAGPCLQTFGVCLGILGPVGLLGTAIANNQGTASYTVALPSSVPPSYLFTQAVVFGPAGSITTNVITAPILGGALDFDGDGYCAGTRCHDSANLPGDCDDNNPSVRPDQTTYFDVPYVTADGTSSFDYDCNGRERKQLRDLYDCDASGSGLPLGFCADHTEGWTGAAAPACGDIGTWGSGCYTLDLGYGILFCNNATGDSLRQTCR